MENYSPNEEVLIASLNPDQCALEGLVKVMHPEPTPEVELEIEELSISFD